MRKVKPAVQYHESRLAIVNAFAHKYRRYEKPGLILLWCMIAVLCYLIYAIDPVQFRFSPQCMFFRLTGFYCPGCGTARSLHALFNLKLSDALDYNAFTVAVLPFIVYSLAAETLRKLTKLKIPLVILNAKLILLIFFLVILFWILRNIPVYPFDVLAP